MISIQDVYKMDKNSKSILTERYGTWDQKKGLKVFEPDIYKRRSNFNGFQLK